MRCRSSLPSLAATSSVEIRMFGLAYSTSVSLVEQAVASPYQSQASQPVGRVTAAAADNGGVADPPGLLLVHGDESHLVDATVARWRASVADGDLEVIDASNTMRCRSSLPSLAATSSVEIRMFGLAYS